MDEDYVVSYIQKQREEEENAIILQKEEEDRLKDECRRKEEENILAEERRRLLHEKVLSERRTKEQEEIDRRLEIQRIKQEAYVGALVQKEPYWPKTEKILTSDSIATLTNRNLHLIKNPAKSSDLEYNVHLFFNLYRKIV